MKVSVLEFPGGGYTLRPAGASDTGRSIGRFATFADACRIARLNGMEPFVEPPSEVIQMELPLGHTMALSA